MMFFHCGSTKAIKEIFNLQKKEEKFNCFHFYSSVLPRTVKDFVTSSEYPDLPDVSRSYPDFIREFPDFDYFCHVDCL